MKITRIASTAEHISFSRIGIAESDFAKRVCYSEFVPQARKEKDAETLIEFAGRACYQSWQMPNPETATPEGYIPNIIGHGHFSVLEHASVTYYIEGVSRSLTHELVRHRHLSYSELSQRFVNVEDAPTILPPALREGLATEGIEGEQAEAEFDAVFGPTRDLYASLVESLEAKGYTRKKAREAARAVLPNAFETKIVVTGNHRAWRDFLGKRWSTHADAEIRELAGLILADLREVAPNVYADIPETPYE